MSFWHKHRLDLVGKTYAPPVAGLQARNLHSSDDLQRLLLGCTSFVWKCADESCHHRVVTVAIGKEIS